MQMQALEADRTKAQASQPQQDGTTPSLPSQGEGETAALLAIRSMLQTNLRVSVTSSKEESVLIVIV